MSLDNDLSVVFDSNGMDSNLMFRFTCKPCNSGLDDQSDLVRLNLNLCLQPFGENVDLLFNLNVDFSLVFGNDNYEPVIKILHRNFKSEFDVNLILVNLEIVIRSKTGNEISMIRFPLKSDCKDEVIVVCSDVSNLNIVCIDNDGSIHFDLFGIEGGNLGNLDLVVFDDSDLS